MAQWIAYDEITAAELNARTKAGVETRSGDPLDTLLSANREGLAILPDREGMATVISVRRPQPQPAPLPQALPVPQPVLRPEPEQRRVTTVATGFLGLTDEVVEEEEAQPQSWWRRFWGN